MFWFLSYVNVSTWKAQFLLLNNLLDIANYFVSIAIMIILQ